MRKKIDKSKLTIIILSVVLALCLSVTIVFAAFTANKSSTVTISFDNGLTMRLEPTDSASTFKIATADENSTTFTYNISNVAATGSGIVHVDGIEGTLNKSGAVAYKMVIKESVSGSLVNLTGTWRTTTSASRQVYVFQPSGEKNDWKIEIVVNFDLFSATPTNNQIVCTSDIWGSDSLTQILFYWFKITGKSARYYYNDLAGRTIVIEFTIKARTDQAPTF